MTLVICPNLAIDRMLAGDLVRPGGMTRCRALRTQAGGKGANVLRATRALGGEGLLTGFAAGRGGRLIAELARRRGARARGASPTDGEARVSTVVLGDDGSVTRLYEFGPGGRAGRRAGAAGPRRRPPGRAGRVGRGHRSGAAGRLARLLRRPRPHGPRPPATGCWSTRPASSWPARWPSGPTSSRSTSRRPARPSARPELHCDDEKEAAPEALDAEGLGLCRRLVDAGADGAVLTLGAAGAVAVLDGAEWRVTRRR